MGINNYNFGATTLASLDLNKIDVTVIMDAWEICATEVNKKSKHLSRDMVLRTLRTAADKWNIRGMDFMEQVQNPLLSRNNRDEENEVSQSILDSVKVTLSPQPWQRNEHRRVAKILNLSNQLVYRAIKKLIEIGEFHP